MRFYLLTFLVLVFIFSSNSCRKDLNYPLSTGTLEFSKDTVYLDTVFTNISSSTKTLVVYNRTQDDLEIPLIRLEKGENSSYRLNVDGQAGKEFQNIPILAKDSLYIFIESTFDSSNTGQLEFLNIETIQFDSGNNLQEVQLISLVKDAVFLYPKTLADGTKETINFGLDDEGNLVTIEGFYLENSELDFTNEKPYVIYGYAAIQNNKQLNIEAGTRVFFHKDSGIMVSSGGSLQVNGALSIDSIGLEKEVIFEGDRLDTDLAEVPGQWGTIWFSKGSMNNKLNHLTIRNATVGLLVEGDKSAEVPTLQLTNTIIYNSASINLWGRSASIAGENVVLGSAGDISLYCNLGGSYSFIHSTIANFWQNGFRTGTALAIDNFSENDSRDLTRADFINCIIDGNTFLELNLSANQRNSFEYSFTNCLIKFDARGGQLESNPFYDFGNTAIYKELLLNENANFFDAASNDLRISDPSAARDKASFEGANLVPLDLLGRNRTGSPDIGAYEIETAN